MKRLTYGLLAALFTLGGAFAQDTETPSTEPPMTLSRMAEIIFSLDENAKSNGNSFQITIQDIPVLIITDPNADRMRAMAPIRASEYMTPEELLRVMQANFDTALDARYAIAHGKLWGTFIHPLASLEKDEFISGLGQTVNIAKTYGTLYSGGALSFGGGDSIPLQRQLIDDLLKKGEEI
jgi:hypothetical protein